MMCYSCKKYDECEHPWKCDETMYDCTAYELEQTNEEWLHTLNTEQLANFVIKTMLFYDNAGITVLEAIKNAVEDNENLSKYFIENVVEWLKQPHTPKE